MLSCLRGGSVLPSHIKGQYVPPIVCGTGPPTMYWDEPFAVNKIQTKPNNG